MSAIRVFLLGFQKTRKRGKSCGKQEITIDKREETMGEIWGNFRE